MKEIRSDNGTNFISANQELKNALKELNQSKIQNYIFNNGVKWTFSPPHGAHHGGVWERLVQQIKKMLFSVVKQQMLDGNFKYRFVRSGINTEVSSNHSIFRRSRRS